jgi:hypothetical protein
MKIDIFYLNRIHDKILFFYLMKTDRYVKQ